MSARIPWVHLALQLRLVLLSMPPFPHVENKSGNIVQDQVNSSNLRHEQANLCRWLKCCSLVYRWHSVKRNDQHRNPLINFCCSWWRIDVADHVVVHGVQIFGSIWCCYWPGGTP